MAKRKKSKGGESAMGAPSSGRSGHISTSIDEVDNGFIVNASGETAGKEPRYFSKRMIASDRPSALRIASDHLSGGSKKGGKKKSGNKKKILLKRG